MVDFNKEIKVSDLFKRPKKAKSPRRASTSSSGKKRQKSKKQEIVGLKIGASQLAAARVVNNGATPRLVQLARSPLEAGIVTGGEVRDVEALALSLDKFFTEHKLPRRGIRLGVSTNRIGVRSLDVDGIEDERQLENAVRFRAHEALAIPMDQAVLDFHVTRETVDESGAVSRRVLLAAAYREPIDHYVSAFRAANLELIGIDVEAFALLRAVAPASRERAEGAALVALSVGHDRSTLAISDGVVCDFMRVLEWGGGKLDSAIARDLGLTLEEAAELKLAVSLDAAPGPDDDLRLARARTSMLNELQALSREVVASLQFSQSEPGSLPIGEILVTGGTTRLQGFTRELERLIRARVSDADPLSAVVSAPGLSDRDDLASLAIAIGLGVEQ
jgi:type IV pilus assembly protein PilM